MKKSRKLHTLLLITGILISAPLAAQAPKDTISGEVSYTTTQSIYVRFKSTKGINPGDTLFAAINETLVPLLIVKNLSSTSVVGNSLTQGPIEKGTRIIARKRNESNEPVPDLPEEQIIPEVVVTMPEDEAGIVLPQASVKKARETQMITGRISAGSYVYFSDDPEYGIQRMRYTFTLKANKIGNTRLSAETYMSFRHTLNEWQEVKDNFGRAFKVYNLALQYDADDRTTVWFGRKINYNLSNVGAIDGLQAEKRWRTLFAGVFAGSRPDYESYGFDLDLLQFGAYGGLKSEVKNGSIQSTIAFAEQRNKGMTDRRFAYIQHINSAIKRVYIFTSFEFDLYAFEDNKPKNTFQVSSLYTSIRYKPFEKLSVFGSYDARKNIIYYETYKNFLDQLLEDETRQGFRFSFNYRPFKRISINSSAGYRFQKDNPGVSKNLHSSVTVSRIPVVNVSGTVSMIWIQSPYLNGFIYGIRASRDIISGKLFGELEYRVVKNRYTSNESLISQSIAGGNISWRMSKKLSFSANYEGEVRDKELSNRVYLNIIQRF